MMTLSATCSLTCPGGLYNQKENDSSLVDGYETFILNVLRIMPIDYMKPSCDFPITDNGPICWVKTRDFIPFYKKITLKLARVHHSLEKPSDVLLGHLFGPKM